MRFISAVKCSALLFCCTQSVFAASLDGKIEQDELFHDQSELFLNPAEPAGTTPVSILFRCLQNDLTGVELKYFDEADKSSHSISLTKSAGTTDGSRYQLWQGTLPASKSHKHYRFKVSDGNAVVWYNANGAFATEADNADFIINPDFIVPQWLKDGVIYQIFPDRFFNGNRQNDVKTNEYKYGNDSPIAKRWGESPIPKRGQSPAMTFYGGDLQGIIQKLKYIRSTLGANIIYLNPIFKSPSNHKYDTTDYSEVDPHFGSNSTLQDLTAELHKPVNGKRGYLLLDAVFNHTGDSNIWFRKYSYNPGIKGSPLRPWERWRLAGTSTLGAYQSKKSPYYSYFTFFNWPDDYASFFSFKSLPKLDFASKKVKEVIYANKDSIALHYLKPPYNIDGWRIDAAQHVDYYGNQGCSQANHEVWREYRKAIKSAFPNSAILAENWQNVAPWTAHGDQWDCATNFLGFTLPVSAWLTGKTYENKPFSLSVSQFDRQLRLARAHYPGNVQYAMSNHLSNHDISRFAERAQGDINKTKLALLFQMTYIGAPTIYYGDEYGMRGAKDPDDRRTFDWSKVEAGDETIAWAHKLISIRDRYSALRTGSFITLNTNDAEKTYAFGRFDKKSKIAVVLNNDKIQHPMQIAAYKLDLPDTAQCTDALSSKTYSANNGIVSVDVPPESGLILVFD